MVCNTAATGMTAAHETCLVECTEHFNHLQEGKGKLLFEQCSSPLKPVFNSRLIVLEPLTQKTADLDKLKNARMIYYLLFIIQYIKIFIFCEMYQQHHSPSPECFITVRLIMTTNSHGPQIHASFKK